MADINYVGVGKSRSGFKQCKQMGKRCSPLQSMTDLGMTKNEKDELIGLSPTSARSSHSSQSSYASCCSGCCIGHEIVKCTECTRGCKDTGCVARECTMDCRPFTKHVGGSYWWRRGGGKHICRRHDEVQTWCRDVFDEMKRWKELRK